MNSSFCAQNAYRLLLIAAIFAALSPPLPAQVTENDATVFGYKLRYREAGTGPVVILLHGLGGDGSRWTSTMSTLGGQFRVIALDQIGFGQSDKPLVNYNHALLAEFLVEFLNTLDVPQASIVGHSMGAFVGTYVAVHHPEKLDRLVVVDGGSLEIRPRDPQLVRIQNGTTLAETREYFELMFLDKSRVTDTLVRDNYLRRIKVAFTISRMQESREQKIGYVSKEEASRIAAPTLILWGTHDVLLPPADAELLDRVIPNSRLVMLKKSGHIPQIEQPQEFNQSIRDFLSGDERNATSSR
jgi:2-hydroxy-6-oxonona-2,4-dienedioate hydrolase